MKPVRNNKGSLMVELAMTMPIFLLVIFSFIELSRALYIFSTLGIAAQKVASKISIDAKRTSTYDLSGFGAYADQVRFPGAVVDSNQFSFDVTDASNTSTVTNGLADGATSTKVVVNVSFPPSTRPELKIPIFDPGSLIGKSIFGQDGLQLMSQAVCFLERSRRPTLN